MIFFNKDKKLKEYVDILKKNILPYDRDDNIEFVGDDYFEWTYTQWMDFFRNSKSSPKFKIGNYNWKTSIYFHGFNLMGKGLEPMIKILDNLETGNNDIYIEYVFSFRSCLNYSKYKIIESNFGYFNNSHTIKDGTLISMIEFRKNIKPLFFLNKIVLGIYMRVYKVKNCKIGRFIYDLRYGIAYYIKNKIIRNGYYEWSIMDWNKINKKREESTEFDMFDHKWKLVISPNKDENEYLSCNLYLNEDSLIDDNECLKLNYIIYIRNINHYACYKAKKGINKEFKKNNNYHGANKLIKYSDLYEYYNIYSYLYTMKEANDNPIVEDNKAVIGVYYFTSDRDITDDRLNYESGEYEMENNNNNNINNNTESEKKGNENNNTEPEKKEESNNINTDLKEKKKENNNNINSNSSNEEDEKNKTNDLNNKYNGKEKEEEEEEEEEKENNNKINNNSGNEKKENENENKN